MSHTGSSRLPALRLVVLCALLFAPASVSPPADFSPPAAPADTYHTYLPLALRWISSPFLACLVTDTAGVADSGFNSGAWDGLLEARRRYHLQVTYRESEAQSDYGPNLQAMVQAGCDIIVSVGFTMRDATFGAAQANPGTKFTIVDVNYDPPVANILGQVYASDEAAFLAGYLAAGVSASGTLGTFGGLQISPVTIFMDGFALGAAYYNFINMDNISVQGWDPALQYGFFSGTFANGPVCTSMGNTLINLGADVIFPVAGGCGLGAAAAAQAVEDTYFIGVDNDWYYTAPDYRDILLTSVVKNISTTTFLAIESAYNLTFTGGDLTGNLANNGVGLAPYHDLAGLVSPALQTQLDAVRAGIIAGTIPTRP